METEKFVFCLPKIAIHSNCLSFLIESMKQNCFRSERTYLMFFYTSERQYLNTNDRLP
jgi:hypothetical protein